MAAAGEPTGRASEPPRCLCSWNGEKWLTPPSCPYHGIRHLRDRFADVIAAEPFSVFADLRDAEERAAEASRRLEEAEAALREIYRLPSAYPDDPHENGKLAVSFATAQEIARAFLARVSSEGVSSGATSERNEYG